MKTATVREAQHHLSRLLAELEREGEIVLTRRGARVARLMPIDTPGGPFERPVDWSKAIRGRNETLQDLPRMDRNLAVEMREEERH